MTQRQKVLRMLQNAGPKGIRSDEFFKAYMPRAAARIQELRDEGHDIQSEREGKYVRYVLLAGVGAVTQRGESCFHPGLSSENSGVDSGERSTGDRGRAEGSEGPLGIRPAEAVSGAPARSVPSMFDADDCLTWGA